MSDSDDNLAALRVLVGEPRQASRHVIEGRRDPNDFGFSSHSGGSSLGAESASLIGAAIKWLLIIMAVALIGVVYVTFVYVLPILFKMAVEIFRAIFNRR